MSPELLGAIVLAITKAAPELIQLLHDLLQAIEGTDPDQVKNFTVRLGSAMSTLQQAQTQDERQQAAKEIADAIAHLY